MAGRTSVSCGGRGILAQSSALAATRPRRFLAWHSHGLRDAAATLIPSLVRVLETAWVILALAGCAVLGVEVMLGIRTNSPSLLHLMLAVVGGYLTADFASGFVHFLADTIGSAETPWIGKQFILPFRAHHARPQEIVAHGFVETNGNNCLIALLVLVPTMLRLSARAGGPDTVYALFSLVLSAFVIATSQIHKWAHHPRPPRWVQLLQHSGLILKPRHHAVHHTSPFDRHYCITSGLLDALLDRARFFHTLRRLTPDCMTAPDEKDAHSR